MLEQIINIVYSKVTDAVIAGEIVQELKQLLHLNGFLYVVKKRKKYLVGWGYTSAYGPTFSWSTKITDAKILDEETAKRFANETDGKIIKSINSNERNTTASTPKAN